VHYTSDTWYPVVTSLHRNCSHCSWLPLSIKTGTRDLLFEEEQVGLDRQKGGRWGTRGVFFQGSKTTEEQEKRTEDEGIALR